MFEFSCIRKNIISKNRKTPLAKKGEPFNY